MLVLLLALMGQVRNGEIYWTPQSGTLPLMVDNVGIDVKPLLSDLFAGKKPTTEGLTTIKQITTTEAASGSYYQFFRKFNVGKPQRHICLLGDEVINAPRIYGMYEDDLVYLWGVNFQDPYGNPPKVYLVNDTVTELTPIRPPGDRQGKQSYYESCYILQLNPQKSGKIVVYGGEMGLWGCDWIEYIKLDFQYRPLELGPVHNGNVTVASGYKLIGPIVINGSLTIEDGAAADLVTITKPQPYSVKMFAGSELTNSTITNMADESVCVQLVGPHQVKLKGNTFSGIRACSFIGEVAECVTLNNTFRGLRYTTSGAYFPVGRECVVADNVIENAYRGLVFQSNHGAVCHNLILRNDFSNGGPDMMGGEQIITETKPREQLSQVKTHDTVLVTDGPDKGKYCIIQNGPDRPFPTSNQNTYVGGPISTENLFILNRVTNCRVGLELWRWNVSNIIVGLQCTNVPWGFVQNSGEEHGYNFHNELRDSFFNNSTVVLANKTANQHWLNFKMNRVEFINSYLRGYNLKGSGDGLFAYKCSFGVTDSFPLGMPEVEVPTPPMKSIYIDNITSSVFNDCRNNGVSTTKEELLNGQ